MSRNLRLLVAATDTGVRSRLTPALAGLEHVADGGRFDASGHAPNGGRRFLGWSVGPHWMLTAGDRRARLAFKQA